ncbi:MAG: thiol:disulfide interchange protein DsbA/DsbL [Gammaproteobacteria bacterium]|nr:thiol:disulfide interchange protein DsbA/DsbL [Gammaproteobacteria bacterium]MCY4276855.1 thiol:disulfide interchange protein DsbA/DsbL [Gammaproteobacteria bacterium]MCY4323685.1 thiol:disulfide interchange protein DsbA/DsbL [Gammaproteobacteria bacterium]
MAKRKGAKERAEERRLHRVRLGVVCAVAAVVILIVVAGIYLALRPATLILEEGGTYREVAGVAVSGDATISVTEFFSYGCPACATFEPRLEAWVAELPDDVEFNRVPFVGSPGWNVFARGYFAMRDLELLETYHSDLFDAIDVRGRNLGTAERLADFVAADNSESFLRSFNGVRVERAMQRADELSRTLGIVSVPTLVVDSRYVVIGQGASVDALRVAEMLIGKVREERLDAVSSE